MLTRLQHHTAVTTMLCNDWYTALQHHGRPHKVSTLPWYTLLRKLVGLHVTAEPLVHSIVPLVHSTLIRSGTFSEWHAYACGTFCNSRICTIRTLYSVNYAFRSLYSGNLFCIAYLNNLPWSTSALCTVRDTVMWYRIVHSTGKKRSFTVWYSFCGEQAGCTRLVHLVWRTGRLHYWFTLLN